jgi:tRNA threonylcarbamoyladenosine biosynthesis protein TsaE
MPEQLLQISYSLANIGNQIDKFWQCVHQYRVLGFSGAMGAGKTTLIHALCDHLGVEDVVSSPTFALINEYHFMLNGEDKRIYHMDWYRLRDEAEAIDAGMEDAVRQEDTYCFIEWAEKAVNLLPKPYLWIDIQPVSITERTVTVQLIK